MSFKNEYVHYEKREQVAYITLNRPNVLNAMNTAMHEELLVIWDDFETDETIRIGVLSGAGTQAFSVGQDLKELDQHAHLNQELSFGSKGRAGWPRLTERFERAKPLIAKVQGYALGGGFELALACDLIIASDDAQFGLPEAKLGLIAGAGGVFRLLKQMPYKAALGYLLTGRMLKADKALTFGLVNDVVPVDCLDRCVNKWVEDILRCAPLSVLAINEIAKKAVHLSLEQAFTMSYSWEEIRKRSKDAQEGPRAFVEGRRPSWSEK